MIVSGQERCDSTRLNLVNGLACFTLRGSPTLIDVPLNGADGFDTATVCQCDFLYPLAKSKLHSSRGLVSWERQPQIKATFKELLRF